MWKHKSISERQIFGHTLAVQYTLDKVLLLVVSASFVTLFVTLWAKSMGEWFLLLLQNVQNGLEIIVVSRLKCLDKSGQDQDCWARKLNDW